MKRHYIATEYAMSKGVGVSKNRLPSFDKALLDAGVGNYNLVRLSSILPSGCKQIDVSEIQNHIKEGSLLPTAYATLSSSEYGTRLASAMAIGFPEDESRVGVIMEYSSTGITGEDAERIVRQMVIEGFDARVWKLKEIKSISAEAVVSEEGTTVSTFACVAEW